MINLSNVALAYGASELFSGVTVSIKPNSKIGLVGRNGTGKSSLLKMLIGQLSPSQGSIDIPKSAKVGYLSQFLTLDQDITVKEGAALAFDEVHSLESQMAELNHELASREDYESDSYQKLIDKITHVSVQLEAADASKIEAKTEKVLKGLGFTEKTMEKRISDLSGGWKMRVELAKLLLEQPDYLLLDEPINHLDIESIIWLEKWLRDYQGSFVIIAHDEEFMDNCVQEIFEISQGGVQIYKTNFSGYLVEKEIRREQLEANFKNQQKEIARKEQLVDRFRAKASKASMAKSLIKELARMDRVEYEDEKVHNVRIQFLPSKRANQIVVKAKGVSKAYGDHSVLEGLDFEIERGMKVAFVGQNGQGKSTFAKILIDELEASSGSVSMGDNIQLAYFAQDAADRLPRDKTLLEYMEQEARDEIRPKVRSILGAFLFSGEDVDKKISVLSGGEKNRLAFAKLLLEPFNFLVLDEPTHHLDVQSKEILKRALQKFDGTLLIISHDRTFLDGLTEQIIEFRNRKITTYLGDITYFMQKREADSMRQVERKTKEKKESKQLDSTETKEVESKIKSLERQIEKLEKKIGDLEEKMGASGFYESDESAKIIDEHGRLKVSLDASVKEWEQYVEML